MIINAFILIFIGIAGGLLVGCGFVAFLTVLGIVPRLTQLSKTYNKVYLYEWSIVLGALFGNWTGLRESLFYLPHVLLIPIGLFCGTFVGMLAAALTEVVNVIPILTKRIGVDGLLIVAIMAIVFGKVFGSLFHWIYFVDR